MLIAPIEEHLHSQADTHQGLSLSGFFLYHPVQAGAPKGFPGIPERAYARKN